MLVAWSHRLQPNILAPASSDASLVSLTGTPPRLQSGWLSCTDCSSNGCDDMLPIVLPLVSLLLLVLNTIDNR